MGGFGDLVGSLAGGGLEKAMAQIEEKGLDDKAKSWIGTGANEALSSDQVKDALDNDQIQAVAKKLGVTPDQAADAIAEYLPKIVDQVSPDGKLPAGSDLDEALGKLGKN
jgi:uncharacterized protein YidB (DUF937 family)